MKWLKHKNDMNPNNYWDTISDIMSSLLLSLLLVIMLLILYVVRAPDYKNQKSLPESEITEEDGVEEQYVQRAAGDTVVKTDVPYLYSDTIDEEYGLGEETGDFQYEDGGFEEGEFDGHEGAAVQVIVEDAETHSPIREAGVTFSLYTSEGRGTKLYSYYPTRTGWTKFTTDESGSFYLPQKLVLSSYFLHELTAPAGYQLTEDVHFTLEASAAWNDPYVVHIALNSVRGTIHLTAVDSDTNAPVSGCVFNIIASGDITTKDGTVRYSKGTVVDEIVCDDTGEGRSTSLYLGNYIIQQRSAPEYYAVSVESYPVTLGEGENDVTSADQLILCEKTCYIINVVDELYQSIAVSGAEFILQDDQGSHPVYITTDEQGGIILNALSKKTAYTLTQSTAPKGYQLNENKCSFYVDNNGHIDGESSIEVQLTNRTLRLSTLVQDAIFKNTVSGCRVELYKQNQILNAWQSTGVETITEGLEAGKYLLKISGAGSASVSVQVEDIAQVQYICCTVWTTGNKLIVGASAAGITGIGAAIGVITKKRRQKRKRVI